MSEVMFYCLDELVADMVVDPDATNTKSKHTQRVLVVVGQRALAHCENQKRKTIKSKTSVFSPTTRKNKFIFYKLQILFQ